MSCDVILQLVTLSGKQPHCLGHLAASPVRHKPVGGGGGRGSGSAPTLCPRWRSHRKAHCAHHSAQPPATSAWTSVGALAGQLPPKDPFLLSLPGEGWRTRPTSAPQPASLPLHLSWIQAEAKGRCQLLGPRKATCPATIASQGHVCYRQSHPETPGLQLSLKGPTLRFLCRCRTDRCSNLSLPIYVVRSSRLPISSIASPPMSVSLSVMLSCHCVALRNPCSKAKISAKPQPEPQSSRTSPDTCRVPKAPPSSRSSSCGFSMDVKQLSDLSTETRHRRLYLCSSKTWFCSPFHRSSPFYGWPTLVGHSQPSVGPGPAEPEARPPAQREPTRGQGFSVYLWKISHL